MPAKTALLALAVATLAAPASAQRVMTVPGPTVIYSVASDDIDAAKFEAALRRALRDHPELIRAALEKADADRISETNAAIKTAERAVYAKLSEAKPNAPILGNPRAAITLVEMFDYNCGFCRQSHDRIATLIKARPDVRVVMMMTPILSPDSVLLARFALAADQQGRFAAVHDALFTGPPHQATDDDALSALSKATGVDWPRAKTEMTSNALNARINTMMRDWTALGRTGTPSFLTPTGRIEGAVPIEQIEASLPAKSKNGARS